MMADVKLLRVPKWGFSMEEGTITAWLISVGDTFEEGQEICEIETSKIANVLEAPFSGVLRRIVATVGDTLPVQAVIAVAAPAEVSDEEIDAVLEDIALDRQSDEMDTQKPVAGNQSTHVERQQGVAQGYAEPSAGPVQAATKRVATDRMTVSSAVSVRVPAALAGRTTEVVVATPRATAFADENCIDLAQVPGTGRSGRISVQDVRNALAAAVGSVPARAMHPAAVAAPAAASDESTVAATPVARRLAVRWNISLSQCRATGRMGRVCKADVEAARALAGGGPDRAPRPESGDAVHWADTTSAAPFTEIPLTAMRKTIATRLSKSKQDAPHFRVTIDADVDALIALRAQLNREHAGVKVSVNDFIVKAVAMALLKHPHCNIQFDGSVIRRFAAADIAVAVSLEAGLITPIIRSADKKSLVTISNEMRSLATRAKASTLTPDQYQGGTFTVSNLGMFGVTHFDAIINPPQAAILAVGAVREEMRMTDAVPTAVTRMSMTLSSDHRVIDGAAAARFLQTVKRNLEAPVLMLAE